MSPTPQISNSGLKVQLNALQSAHLNSALDYATRIEYLRTLRAQIKLQADDFIAAMQRDFGHRSADESLLADIATVIHECDYALKHLRSWMKAKRSDLAWYYWPARAEVRYQAVGVVGIISPWNYPVNLALVPVISAIAAGNRVMLKPSEHTPQTSQLLARFLAQIFPPDVLLTVQGDASIAAEFSALPFDHLFFTGSTSVGKKVMAAAAQNLTPVTLELGGKSPALIAPDFPIKQAAASIARGKFFNAGQTCIAPDYVLVAQDQMDALVQAIMRSVSRAFTAQNRSRDYTCIINDAQYARLNGYLKQAQAAGVVTHTIGTHDAANRIFAPTVVINPPEHLDVMQQEIFGPILPIIAYNDLAQAKRFIAQRERPLALYVFDQNAQRVEALLNTVIAGGITVNDTLMHFAPASLPFGGTGASGMGHYHGRYGFEIFSKAMPVFYQSRWPGTALLKPPYGKIAQTLLKFLSR